MLKWLFILLLAANLVYLGFELKNYKQHRIETATLAIPITKDTPPLVLISELNTEVEQEAPDTRPTTDLVTPANINFVTADTSSSPSPPPQNVNSTSLPRNNSDTRPVTNSTLSSIMEKINYPACLSFGPIPDQPEAGKLSDWFQFKNIRHEERQTDAYGRQLFRIYLAPKPSNIVAEKILKELKNKGVKDLRVIKKGKLKNAISLGVFSSKNRANKRLLEIKKRGYQPVIVPYHGKNRVYWIDVALQQKDEPFIQTLFSPIELPSKYSVEFVECQ